MPLTDDHPLSGTHEQAGEALRDRLTETDHTVDDLREAIDTGEYTAEQLRTFRRVEMRRDDPRSTALDALDEELDVLTSGPDLATEEPDLTPADVNSSSASPAMQRAGQGAGATEAGLEGVDLPDPYASGAPETLRIFVPTAMGVAGEFYPDKGTYDVPYRTDPNGGDDTRGMQVKLSLESENNPARLSRRDPHHPEYDPDG
ncbi:hypothetical protein [Halalkalicoccus jeotgali]|uniref:Uncharacterized protein n=1 Tax=Halalkalicoccus jeotgali (strain DSM 18796 / CECT 7217 / JCM 14584 / KCTC 4019 / B3) TaxID=795797 RepID=D8J9V6_HALJB|nr:hypothetical protein [Halalkalicoccus jeotgali]ADJ14478.1 hypothetical protein HacjB3_05435 [Halalkalicoccus jeotgali B3]ELY40192.1 hypothetical protein C497_03810 [Halalkalicoccus jeotgali B3]